MMHPLHKMRYPWSTRCLTLWRRKIARGGSSGVGDNDLFGYTVGEASAPSSVGGHGPPGEESQTHQCKIQSSPHAPLVMTSV
jgi:hypothetical protein